MLFNSLEFWLFFVAVFSCQLALRGRGRKLLLLVASYGFYAAWDWRFLSLIWLSTLVDYAIGLALSTSPDPVRRQRLVGLSLAVNLSILGFFKYAGFFSESLAALGRSFGLEFGELTLNVVLPVGISFYTFQTLSYTLDIYRGKLEPTHQLLDFALFVAFFPQLVAGPIERAAHLLPQIRADTRANWSQFSSGCWLVLWGLFKKVVIADNLAGVVDAVYGVGAQPTSGEILLATYAFAFQIYCDFSGYTDIARGLARMMGFDLLLNFDLPYFATSPAEFWDRWHISLSTWLRDYLFRPFSRALMRRLDERFDNSVVFLALFVTMTLCGLWHGAGWTFVLFGVYHGILLCLRRASLSWLPRFAPNKVWLTIKGLATFHLVCVSFLLFRADSVPHALGLLAELGRADGVGSAVSWLLPFCVLIAPLLAMQIAQRRARNLEVVLGWPYPVRVAVYLSLMVLIVIQGEDGGDPFIYFQF
jgi:D-alanyl-lipoteichoic acid acyltransferase DltB (MBOAT superfamily)